MTKTSWVIHPVGPTYSGPEGAAHVSVEAIRSAQTSVRRVLLVAFGEETARLWEQALRL